MISKVKWDKSTLILRIASGHDNWVMTWLGMARAEPQGSESMRLQEDTLHKSSTGDVENEFALTEFVWELSGQSCAVIVMSWWWNGLWVSLSTDSTNCTAKFAVVKEVAENGAPPAAHGVHAGWLREVWLLFPFQIPDLQAGYDIWFYWEKCKQSNHHVWVFVAQVSSSYTFLRPDWVIFIGMNPFGFEFPNLFENLFLVFIVQQFENDFLRLQCSLWPRVMGPFDLQVDRA